MADKKYYWLKLKEDFFEEDTLAWIEEQEKGKEYCLFYLKLCLKSLKNEGILIRNVGQMLIPYDAKKLSELTKTDLDTVIVAMELFKKTGLVQVLENGEIYLTQLKTMVGSETEWAAKKRNYRKSLASCSEDNVLKLSEDEKTLSDKRKRLEKEKDKEIEIEKEIEITTSNNSDLKLSNIQIFKHYEKSNFILSPMLMEKLSADIEIYGAEEVMKAADISDENGVHNYKYAKAIMEKRRSKGVTGSNNKQDNESSEGEYDFSKYGG